MTSKKKRNSRRYEKYIYRAGYKRVTLFNYFLMTVVLVFLALPLLSHWRGWHMARNLFYLPVIEGEGILPMFLPALGFSFSLAWFLYHCIGVLQYTYFTRKAISDELSTNSMDLYKTDSFRIKAEKQQLKWLLGVLLLYYGQLFLVGGWGDFPGTTAGYAVATIVSAVAIVYIVKIAKLIVHVISKGTSGLAALLKRMAGKLGGVSRFFVAVVSWIAGSAMFRWLVSVVSQLLVTGLPRQQSLAYGLRKVRLEHNLFYAKRYRQNVPKNAKQIPPRVAAWDLGRHLFASFAAGILIGFFILVISGPESFLQNSLPAVFYINWLAFYLLFLGYLLSDRHRIWLYARFVLLLIGVVVIWLFRVMASKVRISLDSKRPHGLASGVLLVAATVYAGGAQSAEIFPDTTECRNDSTYCYPLVVVAAAGGGIAAAVWTAEVLDQLDQLSQPGAALDGLSSSISAISTVSGGSVGTYYSLVQRQLMAENCKTTPDYSVCREKTLSELEARQIASVQLAGRSSLGAVAWGMIAFGTDNGREDALERRWTAVPEEYWCAWLNNHQGDVLGFLSRNVCQQGEKNHTNKGRSALTEKYRALLGRSHTLTDWGVQSSPLGGQGYYGLPNWFINTVSEQRGERIVLPIGSNNRLAKYFARSVSKDKDITTTTGVWVSPDCTKQVPVISAVRHSATFPYVTPATPLKVKQNGESNEGCEALKDTYLIDGGYIDNDGAQSILDYLRYYDEKSGGELSERRRKVLLLQFRAFNKNAQLKEIQSGFVHRLFHELASPIQGIMNTRKTQPEMNLRDIAHTQFNIDLIEIQPPASAESLPLSWHLSNKDKKTIRCQVRALFSSAFAKQETKSGSDRQHECKKVSVASAEGDSVTDMLVERWQKFELAKESTGVEPEQALEPWQERVTSLACRNSAQPRLLAISPYFAKGHPRKGNVNNPLCDCGGAELEKCGDMVAVKDVEAVLADGARIFTVGLASASSDGESNLMLGERRSQWLADKLSTIDGVSKEQIRVLSWGEIVPLERPTLLGQAKQIRACSEPENPASNYQHAFAFVCE